MLITQLLGTNESVPNKLLKINCSENNYNNIAIYLGVPVGVADFFAGNRKKLYRSKAN